MTNETAPTLDLGWQLLDGYIVPTVRLTMERWRLRHRRLLSLGLWLVRRYLENVEARKETLDSRVFREKKTYRMYRFRAPVPAA